MRVLVWEGETGRERWGEAVGAPRDANPDREGWSRSLQGTGWETSQKVFVILRGAL